MAAVNEESMQEKLRKIGKGVCLIEAREYEGTGFHYGNGWVMTVAHNFQNDDEDMASIHSLLREATFTFNVDKAKLVFEGRNRMASIHHIKPGGDVDTDNIDIAMVKLGTQWEYGRAGSVEDWEEQEQQQLCEMKLPNLAEIDKGEERQVKVGDKVYAIHYDEYNNIKTEKRNVVSVRDGQVPTIILRPTLPDGASGCPILKLNNQQELKLVGLLVGGNYQKVDALRWRGGIKEYTNEGVRIVVDIGSYMAYKDMKAQEKATSEREELEERGRASNLTVYLTNGEVLNGANQ